MAATTTEFSISSAAWTKVSDGEGTVAIQLAGSGRLSIHLSVEGPGSGGSGLVLSRGVGDNVAEMSLSGIPPSASVWCTCLDEGRTTRIVVLKY